MNNTNQEAKGIYCYTKWYNHFNIPLIPIIIRRKANEHNTADISFTWLFIRIWTLDHPQFEVSFVMDTHWGIGFIGMIPYLRWVVAIPCPLFIERWIYNKLTRKPKNPGGVW